MPVRVRVPATTANLGPGFDCLGAAVRLHNTLTLLDEPAPWPDAFMSEAAEAFFRAAGRKRRSWKVLIEGDVPRARGLGSSVTVRLGLLLALNEREKRPLPPEKILELTIQLEGHPDNAVPAFHGGFAACGPKGHTRIDVEPTLKFVVAIPDFEVETKAARAVLPATLPLRDAILNLQCTAALVGAFVDKNYPALRGNFQDTLHQPYRAPLIHGCQAVMDAALDAGALGAFISGSGSAMMALTLHSEHQIALAMGAAFRGAGVAEPVTHVLTADNDGAVVLDP
ncbi:MAG: homoserine kinase [Candidatus Methylacidiphilales bacterium]|nr:homoserine kinase [Candidatus Methylacidiphilales bacterium]